MVSDSSLPSLPPQTLFLTVKAVENFWNVRERSPVAFERAKEMLQRAQDDLFAPLLTKTEPPDFEGKFNDSALRYAQVRLDVLNILLNVFGPSEFKDRYFVTLAKSFERFSQQRIDLPAADLELLVRHYLRVAIVTANCGKELQLIEHTKLEPLLRAIVRSDFGITALALIFEGTVATPMWRMLETFRCTQTAIAAYEGAVGELLGLREPSPNLGGSLRVRGDLDAVLSRIDQNKSHKGKKSEL